MPQAVLSGRIDIALGLNYADAPQPPVRGVVTELLHREPFLMVLPPGAKELLGDAAALMEFANATDWVLPPVDSCRNIVAIARSAALEKDSVRAVRDALVQAFKPLRPPPRHPE